jgi:hypothetical protein
MRLIESEELAGVYWKTMDTIDRAHGRAGQIIRRMLIQQVMKADIRELLQLGTMAFDLPGTNAGQLIAHRVVAISNSPISVTAHQIGQIITSMDS